MSVISEILRFNPKFQLIVDRSYLEIIDEDNRLNNGRYLLNDIDSIQFIPSKINWFISILSFVVEIFMSGAGSGSYKKDPKLLFNYNNVEKEILLLDCDEEKSKVIIEQIMNRIISGSP